MWGSALAALFVSTSLASDVSITSMTFSSDQTWYGANTYILSGQVFFEAGATLTIQKGTMIKAARTGSDGKDTVLVFKQGARIEAHGTATEPITFTSLVSVNSTQRRGLWGGVVICGYAPIATGGTNMIEGLTGVSYGGTNASDFSGTLRYVRIWHGGADIGGGLGGEGSGKEINGLTLAGVGSSTTVEYVEVAFNLDDGFEIFGGTVNLKHCSSIFNGDDAYDIDEGYQGKMQFIFAIVDKNGSHALEADSRTNGSLNAQLRSYPQLYGATFFKARHNTDSGDGLIELRGGTGGRFGNIILYGYSAYGVQNADCGNETRSSTMVGPVPDSLYFSSNSIIYTQDSSGRYVQFNTSCSQSSTWVNPTARAVDPNLQLIPNVWTTLDDLFQIDPRPIPTLNSWKNVDSAPSDDFFTNSDFIGAFGTNLWLDKWSYLSEYSLIPSSNVFPTVSNTICGNISTSLTLKENQTYYLTCQTLVLQTSTLTIEKGVTIKAYRQDANGKAPTIIVQRDGLIEATGTADLPITFTSVLPERNLPQRGTWGGIILLGNAPISKAGGRGDIEGLDVPFGRYGGVTKNDNSGTLKYVRVWYGGADIGFDTSSTQNSGNEINGITFGGVGSGTTVQYVEVAWNKDDGFEMFGGAVNLKYCSSVFNQDDSFDSDEGYQGKMQFIFAIVDNTGDRACEMDSKTNGNLDSTPRSFPQIFGATFIKANHSSSSSNGLMLLREGTGGVFSNIILAGKAEAGIENKDCSTNVAKGSWEDGNGGNSIPDYLWWSRNNIIDTVTNSGQRNPYQLNSDCIWSDGPTSREIDPEFQLLRDGWNDWTDLGQIDPRPKPSSPAYTAFDNPPSELFYSTVNYAGAFGNELWNDKWSWLSVYGLLPTGVQPSSSNTLCGEITSSMTLYASSTYYLTCQTFVNAPAVLTIEAGTTIRAYSSDASGKATALVIEQGAKIFAEGSKSAPITFTNALHSQALPKRQTWGGLIILGKAPIANGGTNSVEGLDPGFGTYGGTNSTDSSGTLKYVRVWYGGADIGGPRSEDSGNEINGITFAGVGSSTTVEFCEVAWNNDDGFEFFGGTVNVRWLSSIYNKDDAFDVDEGYQGSMQFLFGLVDFEGNHALEIDSMTGGNVDSSPRTFVELYGATFIKADQVTNDALIRIRKGAGGRYANIVALGKARYSLLVDTCGTVTYSQMDGAGPDLLYLAPENYFRVTDMSGNTAEISTQCTWMTTPSVSSVNPSLLLNPFQWTNHGTIAQLDPRPSFDSVVQLTFATPPTSNTYLVPASFAGAFGSDLWLESWSYLADTHRLPENEYPTSNTTLCGPLTESRILPADTYYLTCSVHVKSGATLTLNPGTTIKAYAQDSSGRATTLVIEQGAKIMAYGYANYPITFTSVLPEISLPRIGTWGGVLVLGRARINSNNSVEGTANVEGLEPGYGIYGGFDDADNSGTLRYVRIWYAGADEDVTITTTNENSGNEINGLTLAGVGSGTSISYVEVAYSLDDGIEVFGGTVALDHVAAYFCQDDQFDFDSGYRGQISYAFAMVGATGHRSIECDSTLKDSDTILPRTRVEISQSTFIGNPVDVEETVLFHNGAAGVFALSIISNAVGVGIAQKSCSSSQANTTTSEIPNSTLPFRSQALYIDPFSIVSTTSSQITFDATCTNTPRPVSALSIVNLRLLPTVPTESSKMIDPRPYHATLGPWRLGKDSWRVAAFSGSAPFSGNGFRAKGYNGAFGSDLWLHQWSLLSSMAFLPDNEWTGDSSRLLGGRYSSSVTLSQGIYYLLTHMFMESGTVLTIPAGTTIKAYARDPSGLAPALVIKTGARIEATGTISSPITFTTVLPPTLLPMRGTWGGVIILGEATVQDQAQSGQIEGITGNDGQFGGTNDNDNSGTLTYVRVWYGGADISDSSGIEENEINGITFGAVGSGTKVSYCEVAFNLDDGFELFGGTVDLKYCSSLFNGDDAFDIDLGYRGRMQFLFALVGLKGDHAAEVDSKSGGSVDAQPRSFPQIYGATFVGGAPENTRGSVVRIQEGSAGIFSNMVITNGKTGIENKDCGAENRTQKSPGGIVDMQYLYLYDKNVVFNSHGGDFTQIVLDNKTCKYVEGYPLAVNSNPSILNLPYSATETGILQGLDPRPDPCGELYRDVDSPYASSSFFTPTSYKGAFGVTNWLKGLSILDDYGILSASGIPGVCQTNTGSVVSGDLIFSTATCDDLILETATAEVKAMLASYTGVAITSVTVVGQCGSIIFQYSVAFAAGQVSEANAFATEFVDAPSSVLGANIVTMYGPPVATAQNFIGDDTQPTPAPTQSPTLPPTPEPQAKHIVDRTKETAFMALMIVFFVFTIPAAIGLYMSLKMERKYVKRQMDKWWALALEGNKSNIEIPEEIDIFKKIQDEDASEWIKLFVEFHFKITTNAKLKKLLVTHGRNWKIAMFRFLNQRLVQEEDFQIVDECAIRHNTNTKIKLFKAGFLTQAVLTMAEIDADMFIQYSNKRDKRLYDSLRLIKEATKHGSSDQERTIKGLLLYAILNKISNYICKSSAVEIASHLSIGQWAKMTKLLRVTLRAVCTPTKDEKLFVIHVDPSGIKFSTERLCNTASALLNGGAVRDLISDAAVKRQILESSSRTAKHDIQVRAAALRTYKECFDSISKLMDFSKIEMKHILKERKKHRVQGRRRERKALKDSFLSPGSAENQCLNACVSALSSTKEFKGQYEAIKDSLIFSIGMLEAANNKTMAGLHKIAARTLGGHNGETAGMGNIRLLMPEQVAEISKQLVIANRTKTKIYRAYMSGVKIAVRVLDVGSIRGPIKQAILRHQNLSHTPFVVQLFGVGFSRKHGWFIAMEHIEKNLNELLSVWPPPLLHIRMQIAADIASALQYLHSARVHHGNINPFTILVTNSLQIKITDFTLSTDIDDDEKNSTYAGTLHTHSAGTTSASTSSTMGNSYFKAPEVHVKIPYQNFVLNSKNIMKLDVFSFGAVLAELLSGAGAHLNTVLPGDLPALYYQSLKQAGVIAPPRTTGQDTKSDSLPSPNDVKKAKHGLTTVVLSNDRQFEIAFDLEPFQLPNVVVPIVEKMISLKAENRPDMKLVREEIVRLKTRVKDTEEKVNMHYLKAEHIQEIEKHLIFDNRLKNTKNIYKISLFGLTVVVKLLESENWSEEVKLHHQVSRDNPHVVDMFGCGFSHKMGWFLCMEYVQYTLSDLIFAAAPPPDSTLLQMAIDMADGFAMLHSQGISHRDVKPLNILVTSDFKIRICDFGISTKKERKKESIDMGNFTQQPLQERKHAAIKAAVGTPIYMAPEQHREKHKELSWKASEMVDIYGYGICLLEMFGGIPLKDLMPLQVDLYYKYRNCGGRDMAVELPKTDKLQRIPGPVMVVIRGCMAWSPTFRPTMDRVKIALAAFQKSDEGAKMEVRRQLSSKHHARNYGIGMGESARLYHTGLKSGGGLVSAPDVIKTKPKVSTPISPVSANGQMSPKPSKREVKEFAIDVKPKRIEVKEAGGRVPNSPENTEMQDTSTLWQLSSIRGDRESSTRSNIRTERDRIDFVNSPRYSEAIGSSHGDANEPLV